MKAAAAAEQLSSTESDRSQPAMRKGSPVSFVLFINILSQVQLANGIFNVRSPQPDVVANR